MTKDDVIRLARETGFFDNEIDDYESLLLCFAKLVAEHERKEFAVHAVDIARRAIAEERKACAKIGDNFHDEDANCGDLIRARGQA